MKNSYIDNSINRSKKITLGFILVVSILTAFGTSAWVYIHQLFNAVEKYDDATSILLTLDRARLHELSYTRDLNKYSSDEAIKVMKEAFSLAEMLDEKSDNINLEKIMNELKSYSQLFLYYVSLNEEIFKFKQNIVFNAQQSNNIIDKLINIEIKNTKSNAEIFERNHYETIRLLRKLDLIDSVYDTILLLNKNKKEYGYNNNFKTLSKDLKNLEDISRFDKEYIEIKKLSTLVEGVVYNNTEYTPALYNDIMASFVSINSYKSEYNKKLTEQFSIINDSLSRESETHGLLESINSSINKSRQADRDYMLYRDKSKREGNKKIIEKELAAIDRNLLLLNKTILNGEQENLTKELDPIIDKYRDSFLGLTSITNKKNKVSKKMVSTAEEIDRIIVNMRDKRQKEMNEVKNVAGLISMGGLMFMMSIFLLGYLVKNNTKELQDLTKNLESSIKDANKANEAKSQFLATMSHEIRTPIHAIIGMSHLALEGILHGKERKYITRVNSSAELLLGIINDILDFSKIESQKIRLEHVQFSPYEIMSNLTPIIESYTRNKKVDVNVEVSKRVPRFVFGDPLRLQQILTNLLSNAIKFTDTGIVDVRLDLSREDSEQGFFIIEVDDQGIGMTDQQIHHLYDSFSQADGSTTRKYGGTGLGLAITKNLIELMNGTISVKSELNKGTHFEVVIPTKLINQSSCINSDNKKLIIIGSLIDHKFDLKGEHYSSITHYLSYEEFKNKELVLETNLVTVLFALETINDKDVVGILEVEHWLKEQNLSVLVFVRESGNALQYSKTHNDSFEVSEYPLKDDNFIDVITYQQSQEKIPIYYYHSQSDNRSSLAGAKILIVEDNAINQELIVEILTRKNIHSVVAHNGQIAIDVLKKDKNFDAIIMDCQMPVLDGYKASRIIREDMKMTDIPIIALTANVLASDNIKAKEHGMDKVIHKPFDIDEMLGLLECWIGEPKGFKLNGCIKNRNTKETIHFNISSLSNINGINVDKGLKVCGDNIELYCTLISKFVEKYNVDKPLKLNDESFELSVHTLKGTASSLGLDNIFDLCKKIEEESPNAQNMTLDRLNKAILDFCSKIKFNDDYLQDYESSDIDWDDIEYIISKAKQYYMDSIYRLEDKIGYQDHRKNASKNFKDLSSAMTNYDFDKIVSILENNNHMKI